MIKEILSWLNNTITPYPDTRPDPEDNTAYTHFDLVVKAFEADDVIQILKGGGKPTDVAKSQEDLKIANPPAEFFFWVDVYESPEGKGFVVTYETTRGTFLSKKIYRKAINIGPETWREQDWTEFTPVKL